MVKVFFDLYGHDFSTLINHDILSKHVTKVGLLYAFYVAKVGNPKCNHDLHSSTRRVIYCESCDWEICFARTSGGRTKGETKRDPSMFGPWRLKFLPKLHVDCESSQIIYPTKTLYLLHYRPFVDAVLEDPNISYIQAKKLWSPPYILVSTKCQSNTFSRAKLLLQLCHMRDRVSSYNHLAVFLLQLKELNPNLTIALQLDDQKRFYRLFIGFPQATEFHGLITYSFMQTDGFHFKGTCYDGVCIVYVTKTGFGRNLILGFSVVPCESALHHSWSIQMLWRCNPTMTVSQVTFTDRGPLLNAVRLIHEQLGVVIPINYCDRHFIRNIVSQFSIKKQCRYLVSNGVRRCASSQTLDQFLAAIEEMSMSLLGCQDHSITALMVAKLMVYILKVHPRFWTVFANRSYFDIESWTFQLKLLLSTFYTVIVLSSAPSTKLEEYLNGIKKIETSVKSQVQEKVSKHIKDMSAGPPVPPALRRFNTYTTNQVEGEALRAINNSTRLFDVANAIQSFCLTVNTSIASLNDEALKVVEGNSNTRYTPIAQKFGYQQYFSSKIELLDVNPIPGKRWSVSAICKSDNNLTHSVEIIFDPFNKRFKHLCDKCALSEMMDRPCRCTILAFKEAMSKKYLPALTNEDISRVLFHPAHLMHSVHKCLECITPIVIPTHNKCLSSIKGSSFVCVNYDGSVDTWDAVVLPPPKYKSIKQNSRKRIKSSGEGGRSTARSPTKNREGGRKTKETRSTTVGRLTKKFVQSMFEFQELEDDLLKFTEADDTESTDSDKTDKEDGEYGLDEEEEDEESDDDNETLKAEFIKDDDSTKSYKCSYCREEGHRSDQCVILLSCDAGCEKPADLKAGVYAVYHTPGIDIEYNAHPDNSSVDLSIPPRELHMGNTNYSTFPFDLEETQTEVGATATVQKTDSSSEDILTIRSVTASEFGLEGHNRLMGKLLKALRPDTQERDVSHGRELIREEAKPAHTKTQRKRPTKRRRLFENPLAALLEQEIKNSQASTTSPEVRETGTLNSQYQEELEHCPELQLDKSDPTPPFASPVSADRSDKSFPTPPFASPVSPEDDNGNQCDVQVEDSPFKSAFCQGKQKDTTIAAKKLELSDDSEDDDPLFSVRSLFKTRPKKGTDDVSSIRYRNGRTANPYYIENIRWSIRSAPIVTNTCALDAILFCWYTLKKNGWLWLTLMNDLKREVYDLLQAGDSDGARRVVYSSGPSAWSRHEEFDKYKRGSESNGHGTATRYINFLQPCHIGFNEYRECHTCGRRDNKHRHVDMISIEIFPDNANDLDSMIRQKLIGSRTEKCQLSSRNYEVEQFLRMAGDHDSDVETNEDVLEEVIAKEQSMEAHILEVSRDYEGCCNGEMNVQWRLTHLGQLLIVKQASVKERGWSSRARTSSKKHNQRSHTRSTLVFTDLGVDTLTIGSAVAKLKSVILCDGGHFKVAVATHDSRWIAQDGLFGWTIIEHGDNHSGRMFQCDQFEIAQLIYEVSPKEEGKTIKGLLEEPCQGPNLKISAIARRCTLEISNIIWEEKVDGVNLLDTDEYRITATAITSVISKMAVDDVRKTLGEYTDHQRDSMTVMKKEIVKEMERYIQVQNQEALVCQADTKKVDDSAAATTVSGETVTDQLSGSLVGTLSTKGYEILTVPSDLMADMKSAIRRNMPSKDEFSAIFTCQTENEMRKCQQKKNWRVNKHDGKTYSDGKRLQAKLKQEFRSESAKTRMEKWLEMICGNGAFVMADCKVLKGLRGCHRQQLHTDFDVEKSDELKYLFGILPVERPINLWVLPEGAQNEMELKIKPGELFVGKATLLHGGGTLTGLRLHFLYVEEKLESKFEDYNVTTFITED